MHAWVMHHVLAEKRAVKTERTCELPAGGCMRENIFLPRTPLAPPTALHLMEFASVRAGELLWEVTVQ